MVIKLFIYKECYLFEDLGESIFVSSFIFKPVDINADLDKILQSKNWCNNYS